jgi:predicted adenine nucleotide alpha hydrolase (AANH) superfamily ATPase
MQNYDKKMTEIIKGLNGEKPSLLLHACCAPCSTAVIERIKDYFNLTVFFYNPNMDSQEEYSLRLEEIKRLCKTLNIPLIFTDYLSQEYLSEVVGLESEKEGGKRCEKCFYLRLNKTAELAKEKSFNYFATTLTVSPLKNADRLNAIGKALGEEFGVNFLVSDFKKKNGYMRSIELSKEFGLYRQNYCGCVFSKNSVPN